MTQLLFPFQLERNNLEIEASSEKDDSQTEILDEVIQQLQYAQTISPGLLLPQNYELLKRYCTEKEYPKVLHFISNLCLYENTSNLQKTANAGWVSYGYKHKEKIFGRIRYTILISMLSDIGFTEHIKAVRGVNNKQNNRRRMERLGRLFRDEKRVIIPFPSPEIKRKYYVKKKKKKRINRNDVAHLIAKHLQSLNINSTDEHLEYVLSIQNGGKLLYEWKVFNDIHRKNICLTQDGFGGRVYHPLMAGKEARRFIRVNGKSLVEADIKGSHTFIYHQLLLNDGRVYLFNSNRKQNFNLSFKLSDKKKEKIKEIMIGDIYTLIVEYHNSHYLKLKTIDRNDGKIIYQKAMSGACRFSSKILSEVYGFDLPLFIVDKNLKDRQKFAYVLSHVEKQLVFEAWSRFNSLYADVPCIPRHDSLSTSDTHIIRVIECLKEVFTEAFISSETPIIKIKKWGVIR